MAKWTKASLDEVIRLKRGYDLPESARNVGPFPILGSSGISGWHDEAPIDGPGVTIGRSGASIGVATYFDGPCWPLNTVLFVEDFKSNDPRFVFYLLHGMDFRAYNSGSAQPSLNRNYIAHISILLPPLGEQQAIAAVLRALDDKIAVNDRIEATYEAMLSARFNELRIDVDPDTADLIAVSELIDFNPVLPPPSPVGAVYLDMSAVPTRSAGVREWSWREPKSGTRFMNGCTVMARITPCLENGKTAFVDFMAEDEIGVGSTEFIVMRSRPDVPVHLSYFLARSPRFRNNAVRNMVGSSGRQRVSAAQLVNLTLARPDDAELAAFDETARAAFGHMKSLRAESRNLAELRDTLLPRLMSGEIRVRDAEKVVEGAT